MKRFITFVLVCIFLVTGCRNAGEVSPTPTSDVQPSQMIVATPPLTVESGTEVHILNLGKADCILVIADGEAMLIDAGYEEQGSSIVQYLKGQGISSLKYVVLTHADKDHVGGMGEIIRSFPVQYAFISPKEEDSKEYKRMIAALQDTGTPYFVPKLLQQFQLGQGIFTVLAPGEEALKEKSDNDSTIVLRYDYKERSVLFMGDALKTTEKEMRENGYTLQADIIKIGHHGQSDATTKKFIKAVAPSYAVITCGDIIGEDEDGMPDSDVLNVLSSFAVTTYRTDTHGTVVFKTEGNVWEVQTER